MDETDIEIPCGRVTADTMKALDLWAMHGMVDIRLVLIILAGSLLGVQLGAIGTTYVKEHMIKTVMGVIMLIVAVSRALAIPEYLGELGLVSLSPSAISLMKNLSFIIMCLALVIGAAIILGAMYKARRETSAFDPHAVKPAAAES